MLESFASSSALRAAIPLEPVIPKLSHNRTHHRIARFAAVISSHPKMSPNRPAPSPIETRMGGDNDYVRSDVLLDAVHPQPVGGAVSLCTLLCRSWGDVDAGQRGTDETGTPQRIRTPLS
jgi:hypothetical protein